MFKLSIEVSDHKALLALVQKLGDSVIGADIETTEAPAAAPKASASRAKRAPAKGEEAPSRDPFATGSTSAPVVAQQPNRTDEPAVQQPAPAPSAPVIQPVSFNRDAAIARATQLVGELKATGMADAALMPQVHEVYDTAGCDKALRIGLLDDASLARFIPLFEQKVAAIKAKSQGSYV